MLEPILIHPKFEKIFIITCDASLFNISAILKRNRKEPHCSLCSYHRPLTQLFLVRSVDDLSRVKVNHFHATSKFIPTNNKQSHNQEM